MALHTRDQLLHLVPQLAALPTETEWVEFKLNNDDPEVVGRTLSALANSAALLGQPYGYLMFGVRDSDHAIVGTDVNLESEKVGNEDFLPWLVRSLSPEPHFEIDMLQSGAYRVVVVTIEAASFQPIQFKGVEYIRVGSYVKPLSRHPDFARRLWKSFERQPFETGTALESVSEDRLLDLLDYPSYFQLLNLPLPIGRKGVIDALQEDEIIARMPGTGWRITNLGAILLARRLDAFPSLRRRALRVIQYEGKNRLVTVRERAGEKGYATGFEGLISYVNAALPVNEVIGQALRTTTTMYPELAVRELIANALIHQDFSAPGSGPMIELFTDRVEISNPGQPLVDISKLINAAPRSRNEKLASIMRRMGVCEEQGSGWDKVAFQIEFYQLPAPIVDDSEQSMRVTMLAPRALSKMSAEDKVRAVYLHACLRYANQENTTNKSIRERFGISEQNKAVASRLLAEAVRKGAIVPFDASAAPKLMRYIPFWAGQEN